MDSRYREHVGISTNRSLYSMSLISRCEGGLQRVQGEREFPSCSLHQKSIKRDANVLHVWPDIQIIM